MKCLLCNKSFSRNCDLSRHIRSSHNLSSIDYYDKYLKQSDNEGICCVCGKPTKFLDFTRGYQKHCSFSCGSKDINTQNKIKETSLKKYGVENPAQAKEIKDKSIAWRNDKEKVNNWTKKREETCLSKYGSTSFFSSDTGKEKIKQSYINHFGVDNPSKSKEVRQKVEETNLKKFGVRCNLASEDTKKKRVNTWKSKYGVDHPWKSSSVRNKALENKNQYIYNYCEENDCSLVEDICESYGYAWMQSDLYKYTFLVKGRVLIKNNYISEIINYQNNVGRSHVEQEIYEFVKSLDSSTIQNCRKIITPQELDIYVPTKKVAVEVNGLYWHSVNNGMPKNYHLDKTEKCISLGIRLIHIFEDEWQNKQSICKSIISSSLGIYENRIYARKCIVREVSKAESKQFLEENHIQGNVNSSYRLGLYYNDELVQLITLGKSRYKKGEYELYRMCTKLNTQVIGGFSKLLAHQPYDHIISYIDISKFTGESYVSNNFSLLYKTKPNYFYWSNNTGRVSRISAQKHKLSKFLDNYDDYKTEIQNMSDNGFLQIYDCGNLKVSYDKY